jgi:hypothetical protein
LAGKVFFAFSGVNYRIGVIGWKAVFVGCMCCCFPQNPGGYKGNPNALAFEALTVDKKARTLYRIGVRGWGTG